MSKKIEKPQLMIITQKKRRDISLDFGRTTIGRKTSNTVVIPDPSVSGFHAVINIDADAAYIEDLGSKNGTYINKERLTIPYRLRDNTLIVIGMSTLIFFDDSKIDSSSSLNVDTEEMLDAAEMIESINSVIQSKKSSQKKVEDAFKMNEGDTVAPFKSTQLIADEQPSLEFLAEDNSILKTLALDKAVNPLGRLGVGVAAISFGRNGWVLSPVDGLAPMLNGSAVTTTAALLKNGDVIVLGDLQARFVI